MTITVIYGDPADGTVYASGGNLAAAKNAATATQVETNLVVGQYNLFQSWLVRQGFIAFDLGDIPDGDQIVDVELSLRQESRTGSTARTYQARVREWGPTLTTAAWVRASQIEATAPLVASYASTNVSNTRVEFASDGDALAGAVADHAGGRLALLINSSTQLDATTGNLHTTFTAANAAGTTNDPRLTIEHESTEAHETSGTLGLTLGISATARKLSRSSGSLALNLAASDDAAKTGRTEAALDTELTVDGTTIKTGAAFGAVSLEVVVEAEALANKLTVGTVDLALDLAGDARKAAAVAGALGLTLDITGVAAKHEAGRVSGTIALALAIAATAVKHVEATGQVALTLDITGAVSKTGRTSSDLGLDLGITGTAHPVGPVHPNGRINLTLGIEGAARKHATTVGTLALLLGIVGRIGGDWQLDPCRTLTVQPENRVLMVGPENRTRTIGPETRVLVVAC